MRRNGIYVETRVSTRLDALWAATQDPSQNVPFTISNYPYRDPFGRETVTFVRAYTVGARRRRLDATMTAHDGRVGRQET